MNEARSSSTVAFVVGKTDADHVIDASLLSTATVSPTKSDFRPVLKAASADSTAKGTKLVTDAEQLAAAAVKFPAQLLIMHVSAADGYSVAAFPP